MVYSLAGQVGAVLPSATPVGTGTLTLTYNGAASNALPITVVPSASGIFTQSENGSGAAVMTLANTINVPSFTKAAKPGDIMSLWTTGLGASAGSDAVPPAQVDLGTPIQLLIGNVPATILYRGRSPYPGVDQINFTVPSGAAGCNVSVTIVTTLASGSIVSNSATMPIAPNGGACSDSNAVFPPSMLTQWSTKGANVGAAIFSETDSIIYVNGTPFVDSIASAEADFLKVALAGIPSLQAALQRVSLGSCLLSITIGSGGSAGVSGTGLDAGTSLTFTAGSAAPLTLTGSGGTYSADFSALTQGMAQLSNGSGGAAVGAFKAAFNIPPRLTWTNENGIGTLQGANPPGPTVMRTQPLTVTWSGGDVNSYADIFVTGAVESPTLPVSVSAECTTPVSADSFTIPASVLLAMPGSGAFWLYTGRLDGESAAVEHSGARRCRGNDQHREQSRRDFSLTCFNSEFQQRVRADRDAAAPSSRARPVSAICGSPRGCRRAKPRVLSSRENRKDASTVGNRECRLRTIR